MSLEWSSLPVRGFFYKGESKRICLEEQCHPWVSWAEIRKHRYSIYLPDRAYSNDNASVPVDSLLHEFAQTPLAGECFRHFFTRDGTFSSWHG